MNPALDSIFARRSIRMFTDQPVSNEQVRDILEAAMAAPSAVAQDPWRFVVIKEQASKDRLTEGLPYGKSLKNAPVGIVVCGDLDAAYHGELSYMLQDCSAALQNIQLAASMLGLGTVWLGVHPEQDRIDHVREVLDLPQSVVPVAVTPIGYPSKTFPARTRYEDAYVHRETW